MRKFGVAVFVVLGVVAISFTDSHIAFAANGVAQAENFMTNIIKTIIGFSGLLAVGMVVYGGIRYMTSGANPDQLEKAKNTLKYAGFGLVLVLAAYSLVDWVAGVARSSFGG